MDDKIFEQVLKVRDTGITNMFDVWTVQRVAFERGLYDLVLYLDDVSNFGDYWNFIIFGGKEETA